MIKLKKRKILALKMEKKTLRNLGKGLNLATH
jgi:hypothetical protein